MKTGQGILLKLNYADGGLANKARTFLIISINQKEIRLLNISSSNGKLHKLMYPSNERIVQYNPPFMKPSFVKLDAEYVIEKDEELESFILCSGTSMRPDQLGAIITKFNEYKSSYGTNVAHSSINEVMSLNSNIAKGQVASGKDS